MRALPLPHPSPTPNRHMRTCVYARTHTHTPWMVCQDDYTVTLGCHSLMTHSADRTMPRALFLGPC